MMTKKKLEFKTEWFSIESEIVDNIKSLNKKPFYRFIIPNSVIILATTKAGKLILIRQYRVSAESYTLELPCGQIDKGESPREAAIRELYEESGYVCKKFNLLGVGVGWMDRSKSKVHLFYGQGAVRKKGFKSEEDIEAIPVSIKKFKRLALNGSFKQLQSFALILLAKWKFGLKI